MPLEPGMVLPTFTDKYHGIDYSNIFPYSWFIAAVNTPTLSWNVIASKSNKHIIHILRPKFKFNILKNRKSFDDPLYN